ncbi:MAG: DNA mismatch repair protein MutS, partial [Chitinophagaceae bacterium]|nr:DNA mismatch repair protein MutS [Chitinophagaceae bacterium]
FVLPGFICLALLANILGFLISPLLLGLVFIFLLISGAISRKIMGDYMVLNKIVQQVDTLSKSIGWVEQKSFQSELLKNLQQGYVSSAIKASIEVKKLKDILDRMDLRLNPIVFIPLNIFLFWDLQQIISLEKWKVRNKDGLLHWFPALAEFEALSTLGNLHLNHPDWVFPEIDNGGGTFKAAELGHPLIPQNKRVSSSFETSGKPQLALVTGSNMAGKSTFLRSVGVNIVLGTMGAPVCAVACRMSVMRVISSMRIADNLAESTSTFYAELKKLKYIIEAVNRQEPVFLLLDEILRGTNSLDRHTGSEALINQLIRHSAVGMLATHDLELARLEQQHPAQIHNYHFDVQVDNDELYFDYKLKHGVCKSLNASILMKKIGIEL